MNIFVGVIVGLLVLMFLVIAHEFGHFIAARRNGVNVLEFGIGFPPRAIAWIKDKKTGKWRRLKRSEWEKEKVSKVVISDTKDSLTQKGMIFSLNWLPIGGFCQMDGESAADTREGTFGKASFLSKTRILFAGVAMNWLVAFIILTILAWTGMPEFLDNQFTISSDTRIEATPVEVAEIAENSPAEKAGFKVGDLIIAVDGNNYMHASEITDYNEEHAGEEVTYTVSRMVTDCINQPDCYVEPCPCLEEGEVSREIKIPVVLNESGSDYLLGIAMQTTQTMYYSTWSAPLVGAGLTLQLTGETFKGVGVMLGNLISGTAKLFSPSAEVREDGQAAISSVGDSVSGPAGPTNLAFLAALISVSLACMNVLPIPALDGGRWLLIAIYKVRGKKLTKETEEKIVARAFMVLLALIFIVTILDIVRIAR